MPKTTKTTPPRVPLSSFLTQLGSEEAGHAKAAAEAIDELERHANVVRGIERQLLPYFAGSAVAFIVGLIFFWFGREQAYGLFEGVYRLASMLLLGALPALFLYYAIRVRKRSRADARSFDLNQQYFIPHGGIYFPASGPSERACVVLIDPSQGWKPKPSKYDHIKPSGPFW